MNLFSVIKKVVVNQKATNLWLEGFSVVQVDNKANKYMIKRAIKELYWFDVKDVKVINVKWKVRKVRWNTIKKKKPFKKAYILLKNKDDKLDFVKIKK